MLRAFFHDRAVHTLGHTVLLRAVGHSLLVHDPIRCTDIVPFLVDELRAVTRTQTFDVLTPLILEYIQKCFEFGGHLVLLGEKVHHHVPRVVVDEREYVPGPSLRHRFHGPRYVRVYKLKHLRRLRHRSRREVGDRLLALHAASTQRHGHLDHHGHASSSALRVHQRVFVHMTHTCVP